jgi:L-threonylcarbamoyladenylate synthase
METQLLTRPDEAAALLREGRLVALPTETVYGLAGNGFDDRVVAAIYEAKGRPAFDPLILHLPDAGALPQVAARIPDTARALADAFWPGPLTLVLPRTRRVPDLVTSGLDTVALRVPDHPLTREVLRQLRFPLAAPSANPFGYVSPTTAAHVLEQLGDRIAGILDGGPCKVGLESTIVGFPDGRRPVIYRLGGLPVDRIEAVAGTAEYALNRSGDPRAPGQLASHYAPRVPLRLGDPEALAAEYPPDARLGLLAFRTRRSGNWAVARVLSRAGDPAEAARKLFGAMRELDAWRQDGAGLDAILAEPLPVDPERPGLAPAVNDRLERAAGR